ncbi:MAG TPA: DUF1285 domain-containing protein [Dongiaceae bacterium]|nr:DUF1285 domain-containing protein [Dongiaceae bacterium]
MVTPVSPTRAAEGGGSIEASCGDFDIRIGRDGTWFYHGSPIGRKPLVRLFASVLRREADGGYWLVTPVERGRIVVDDAPFTAVELTVEGAGRDRALSFRTNIDDVATADADHPIRVARDPDSGEPRPYIHVRDGLEARILRPLYYELVALGEERRVEGETLYGVWSKGTFFPLGRLDEAG